MPILVEADHLVLEACGFRMTACRHPEGWQVDGYPGRSFVRNAAITALTLEERVVAGFGPNDPHVKSWLAELGLTWGEFTGRGGSGTTRRDHRKGENDG